MAGFSRISEIADAEKNGKTRYSTWRKSPTQTTTAGVWFDLSMSPGNPVPQYYAASPAISVQMKQSTDGGLFHSGAVSPLNKFLRSTMVMTLTSTALPMTMMLLDYLLYYPFIDEGTTDEQALTNSVALPRYTNGAGVQVMAISVAARTGGQSFRIKYTNQDGVTDRISQTVVQNTATANGHIVTSSTATANGNSPFIPLQIGDTGVRSIQSVTMVGADVGLFTLVLVKPLCQTMIRGIDAPVEKDYLLEGAEMPLIYDDAYLNWICLPKGALNATAIHGD
jgi:hypothetical protein